MRYALYRVVAVLLLAVFAGNVTGSALAADSPAQIFRDTLNSLLGGDDPVVAPEKTVTPTAETRVPLGRGDIQLSFAPLVRKAAPAVVNVYAARQVQARSPLAGDPFFEKFFGRQSPPRVQSSLGSGVIVDSSGIVVTNYHVIRGGDDIKVALSDGREFESSVLLKDERVDIAVLKIRANEPFPFVPFGDSEALEIGDLVLAFGNPFGVGQTTTSGIVSALARNTVGISDFGFFIQTDAAINPGNSGGGLINMSGNLIGINTAIYSRSGGSIGIGFAIPSNMVRAVVEAAMRGDDYFERPFLGAGFEVLTPAAAESLGLDRPFGAMISSVFPGGPADEAGLIPGDVVLALNGTILENPDALGYRIDTQVIDSKVELEVLRRGKRKIIPVHLKRAPGQETGSERLLKGRSPFSGARVADLSPHLAQRLGISASSEGVVIVDVTSGSPAAQMRFQAGDIVREVNGEEIDHSETLARITQRNSRWWRFAIERDGRVLRQVLRY